MHLSLLVPEASRLPVRVGGRRLSLPARLRTSNQASVSYCDVFTSPTRLRGWFIHGLISKTVTKQSPPRPESLPITLALQLRERGLSRTPNMHEMTRRRLRRSAEKATERMKTNDGCVRTHSAKLKRIGSAENRAVHPESMHGSPNQGEKLLFNAESEPDSDKRRENQWNSSHVSYVL
jgi:hypothetical protein